MTSQALIDGFFKIERRFPQVRKALWRTLYGFLAWRFPADEWFFMNYGYCFDNSEFAPKLLDIDDRNRFFINLYAYTLGQTDVIDKDVLEVGSGRGGGSEWIARTQQVRSMTGVDLSENAINLCKKNHKPPHLTYKQGDAEKLPFDNQSFDVALNIESSHHYPLMPVFLQEVERVLRPGGYFCLADYRDLPDVETFKQQLKESPLELLDIENITPNVIKALELTNAMKVDLIEKHVPQFLRKEVKTFAGVKDTEIHNQFVRGDLIYLSALLQKKG
ncbi:MAG: class I SAM-dependent methyltransferase [Nitrospinae bacterium]|nr:class I SAM-dependent methyltransferase [Nitrospinota bacterium]